MNTSKRTAVTMNTYSSLVYILHMVTPNQKFCLRLLMSLAHVTQQHLGELNSEGCIFTLN